MSVLFTAPLGAILAPKDGVNLAPICGDQIDSFGIDIVHSECVWVFFKVNKTLYDYSPTLSYFQCRRKWNVP